MLLPAYERSPGFLIGSSCPGLWPGVPARMSKRGSSVYLPGGRGGSMLTAAHYDNSRMELIMGTIAKISEISCQSTKSFEDAIVSGISRANKTLRQIESAWVKEMKVAVEGGHVKAYQVNMLVTFVLD